MTMYVVKVGTNVKTANPDSADSDRFDFYGPFTRPVADELADEVRAEFAKHGPEGAHQRRRRGRGHSPRRLHPHGVRRGRQIRARQREPRITTSNACWT